MRRFIPQKFVDHPWKSMAYTAAILLVLAFGGAEILSRLAETFGQDRVADWIEKYLDIGPSSDERSPE